MYYYHKPTKTSQWHRPEHARPPGEGQEPLPSGWVRNVDPATGVRYPTRAGCVPPAPHRTPRLLTSPVSCSLLFDCAFFAFCSGSFSVTRRAGAASGGGRRTRRSDGDRYAAAAQRHVCAHYSQFHTRPLLVPFFHPTHAYRATSSRPHHYLITTSSLPHHYLITTSSRLSRRSWRRTNDACWPCTPRCCSPRASPSPRPSSASETPPPRCPSAPPRGRTTGGQRKGLRTARRGRAAVGRAPRARGWTTSGMVMVPPFSLI